LSDAHVFQQLPSGMRRARWPAASQFRRKILDYSIKADMRVLATFGNFQLLP
jgi:hypothetical protein